MNRTITAPFPTADICEKARLSRDARFDGVFFTAVLSTRIYCRPVCPARALGFRPCLRCRPELAPGNSVWLHGEHRVARALKLIHEGFLAEHSLDELAARLDVGGRQLRRLFVQHLGASPIAVHATQRLLFAKPITEVALASGFQSLRRFNSAFAEANHVAPRELRRKPKMPAGNALVLRLGYRPPYDFTALLAFLAGRALPGIEVVEADSYRRVFGSIESPSWLHVSLWPGEAHALKLELFNVPPAQMLPVVTRIRRMFDLDADPQAIVATLGASPVLAPLVERYPGQRLPGGWDGFEVAVRAVLGQQVSVAAARTLAARLLSRFGSVIEAPPAPGLDRLFPTPEQLLEADLGAIGVIRARTATIQGIARALLDGRVNFRTEQRLEDFVRNWVSLPGIGEWTAHYIAMRVLNHPDAFPAADLILRREVVTQGPPLSTRALEALAEDWRPWRAYSVMYLWRQAVASELIRRSRK